MIYLIFKVVKGVEKVNIYVVFKKQLKCCLLDEYIVSNYKNGLKWKKRKIILKKENKIVVYIFWGYKYKICRVVQVE